MNKFEILPYTSFQSICRTCLMHSELFQIHEVNWEGITLSEIIQDWTCLQGTNDELLPQNMCEYCIKRMYQVYHFMSKCKNSERVLQHILFKESIKDRAYNTELKVKDEQNEDTNVNTNDNTDNNLADGGDYFEDTLLDNEKDNCSVIDNLVEVKSEASSIEEQSEDPNTDSNIINKIQSIKNQISKIRVKNKIKLRQNEKARLVNHTYLLKSKKRAYGFRKRLSYSCGKCGASYQTPEELNKHKIETQHSKSFILKCQFCQKKFDFYAKYKQHVRTHTGEKPHKCPSCGKGFNGKGDLNRHIMEMHMKVKALKCRFCSKGFSRTHNLRNHERLHTGEQLLCPLCGKGFHSYTSLLNHKKIHMGHGKKRHPTVNGQLLQCDLCGKVLYSDKTLKDHMLLHEPRNFSCEICGTTHINKQRLQQHIGASHQRNKFVCHICDKYYRTKLGLIRHLESHSGQNNYSCEICGKQFVWKSSLRDHMRVHVGDTKYQCRECFQICRNKRHLEKHTRIHTGEKPFVCQYCGKLFADETNMSAHLKIHTGEKNYICELCGKTFYNKRGLKKHVTIHAKNGDKAILK